jgi:hypothetical protein
MSKTGYSITTGVPGAHINYDLSGRRKRPWLSTLSLPGTGLSYRENLGSPRQEVTQESPATNEPELVSPISFLIGLVAMAGFIIWLVLS